MSMGGGTLSDEGLLYYCRRKYLAGMGRNNFQPPRELKTRRQLKREHLTRKEQERGNPEETHDTADGPHHVHFQNPVVNTGTSVLKGIFATTPKSASTKVVPVIEKINTSTKLRKSAVSQLVMVAHEKPALRNVTEADWIEEYRGGISFYVNKRTGDVTTKCPWQPGETVFDFSNTKISNHLDKSQQRPHTSAGLQTTKSSPSLTINTSVPLMHAGSQTFTSTSMKLPSRKKSIRKDNFFDSLKTSTWKRLVPVNEDMERGTGSLVYNQDEMEEFLRLLDRVK